MSSKTVLIILAVLGGSCVFCGGGLAVLALIADSPSNAGPEPRRGSTPAELVGFWDGGATKFALFSDGTAKKWVRYHWNGKNNGNTCKLEGDLRGTWSAVEGRLSVTFSEGRWVNCRGEQEFETISDSFVYRFSWSSGIEKKVLWLRNEHGEEGFNFECEAPSGCRFEPAPIP